MSSGSTRISVAGIDVEVVRENIKNLHISVYPPAGRVRVSAPERLSDETIRLAIVQRMPWIKRQRAQLQQADRQTKRQMLSGESHYVWGRRYRLDVTRTSGHYGVEISGSTLYVITPEGSEAETRFGTLDRWYRRQLKAVVPDLVAKWAGIIGVDAPKVVVRRMKTKWGTCAMGTHTILLNSELAKKDPRCLEYIIVHEMTHFVERGHGDRFVALMDQYLPDWQARRDDLNEAPLADEEWEQ